MNYKYISSDEKTISIEFTVGKETFTEKFDIRCVPKDDKQMFDSYCKKFMEAYEKGKQKEKEISFITDEVVSTKGIKQEIAQVEEVKEEVI